MTTGTSLDNGVHTNNILWRTVNSIKILLVEPERMLLLKRGQEIVTIRL